MFLTAFCSGGTGGGGGGGEGVVFLDNTHFDSGYRHKTLMISVKISLIFY